MHACMHARARATPARSHVVCRPSRPRAVLNAVLSPFILMFILIFYLLKNAEILHKQPGQLANRQWCVR
jgi:hypothetical protein